MTKLGEILKCHNCGKETTGFLPPIQHEDTTYEDTNSERRSVGSED